MAWNPNFPGEIESVYKADDTARKYGPGELSNIGAGASTWGQFIPTWWGNVRLAGYMVWVSPFYNIVTIRKREAFVNEGAAADGGFIAQPIYGTYTARTIITTIECDAAFSFGYNGLGTPTKVTRVTINDIPVYNDVDKKNEGDFGFTIRYGNEDYPEPIMVKHEVEDEPSLYYPGQLVVTFEGLDNGEGSRQSPVPESVELNISSGASSGTVGTRVEVASTNKFESSADTYHPDYKRQCWYRYRANLSAAGSIEKWDMATYELIGTYPVTITTSSGSTTRKLQMIYLEDMQIFIGQHDGPEDEKGRAAIYAISETGAQLAVFGSTGYTFDTPAATGINYCRTMIKALDTATEARLFGNTNGNPAKAFSVYIQLHPTDGYIITATDLGVVAPDRIAQAIAPGKEGICYARYNKSIVCFNGGSINTILTIPTVAENADDGIDMLSTPLYAMTTYGTDLIYMHNFAVYRYKSDGTRVYKMIFDDPLQGKPGAGNGGYWQISYNVQSMNARRNLDVSLAGSWGNRLAYELNIEDQVINFIEIPVGTATITGSGYFWDSDVGQHRDIARGNSTTNAVIQLPFTAYGGKIYLRDFIRSLYVNTGKFTAEQITFVDIDDMITGALMIKGYDLDVIVDDTCKLYQIEKLEGVDFIKFFRTRALIGDSEINYDIDIDELAVLEESGDAKVSLITRTADPEKLVSEIELKFIDPEADYNENTVQWRRPDAAADATNKATFTTIIIMTKSEALLLLQNKYTDIVTSNTEHELLLPISYSDALKGDILRVKHKGFRDVMRITETNLNGNHTVKCICDSIVLDKGSVVAIPDKSTTSVGISLGKGTTTLLTFDVPSLHYTHNNPMSFAYYYSGYGTDKDWKGGYVTRKNSTEREGRIFETFPSAGFAMYKASNALTNKRWVVDTDSLNVTLLSGEWPSTNNTTITEIINDNKRNLCLYGKPGRWEVVQVASIVDGVASGFIRGCRGTEGCCGLHQPDDLLYIIDTFIVMDMRPIAQLNVQDQLKAVSFWEKFADKDYVNDSPKGVSLKPWAPFAIAGVRDSGTSAVSLTWVRRDRASPPMMAGAAPMSEDDEVYELEIIVGSTVKRTVKGLLSPQYSYSLADQNADGVGTTLQVKIYQISAQVGRGYAGEAKLNV